jgi:hypothetical protein
MGKFTFALVDRFSRLLFDADASGSKWVFSPRPRCSNAKRSNNYLFKEQYSTNSQGIQK